MARDWKDTLQQLGDQLARQEQQGSLQRAQELISEHAYAQALALLGTPRTAATRVLAARAHYGVAKAACGDEAYGRARDHAAEAMRYAEKLAELRGLRALTQQRLDLLKTNRGPVSAGRKIAHPVAANVGGVVGWVPVLGSYSSYGIGGGGLNLNDIIKLLKRGVDELDPREARERERAIPKIALALSQLLRRLQWAHTIDLILPVPADPQRAAERGYSPQAMIAKELGIMLAIPCREDVVRQTISTRKLQGLSQSERAYELDGVFEVAGDKMHMVSGMRILLVDDVVTYGTHFTAITHLLEAAGAEQVQACAVVTARDNRHPCLETDDGEA